MSTPTVKNFVLKSLDKKFTRGLPRVDKTLKACLLDLQQYINGITNEYVAGSTYDDLEIAQGIYKIDTPATDENQYAKVTLFAANRTLNNIVDEIGSRENGLVFSNIKLYSELILDLLVDLNPFVNYFKNQFDPDYVFFSGGKNYLASSFETYMLARNFFYGSLQKNNFVPFKEGQGLAAMTIRQSIEIKTKRIFGIKRIDKTRRGVQDYGFRRIFNFIEDNRSDISYNPIDFEILKLIYKWSCAFIHNGEVSYLWQTEYAFKYLKPFFAPGTHVGPTHTTLSAFGAFQISNFNSVRTSLNAFVGNDYSIEYLPDSLIEALVVSRQSPLSGTRILN